MEIKRGGLLQAIAEKKKKGTSLEADWFSTLFGMVKKKKRGARPVPLIEKEKEEG